VTITAHGPATYDDLLKLPENVVGEIIDGELYASPRPRSRHNNAASGLLAEIRVAFQHGRGPGGWWILGEPELHLLDDVVVPDIAGWRRERMPELQDVAWHGLVPDWVCEVPSPSTGRIDRTKKLPIYAREAVSFAWLVDPAQKTIEVLQLTEGLWHIVHVYGGDDKMSALPFDAITIDLRAIWG
jgi:Uma2 family endonuclease